MQTGHPSEGRERGTVVLSTHRQLCNVERAALQQCTVRQVPQHRSRTNRDKAEQARKQDKSNKKEDDAAFVQMELHTYSCMSTFSYRERTEDSSRELRLQTVRSLSSLHPGRKRGEGGGTKRDGAVDTEGRRRTAHTTVEAQGVAVGAHGASSESDARWPQCCAPTT